MANNSQSRTARRKQKKSSKKPLWKKILLIMLLIFIIMGIGAGATAAYWIATAPDLDESKLSDPLASQILDKDGEVFATLGEEKRTKISYDDLPQVLIDAVTATEDARFFEHSGIDLRRIGGAVIANFKNGFGSEGASTITQQVVEKSFLSADKKISLKV
ncbi:penicillin-binding protein, partial [Halomonas sp. MG34]|nr:penicillin-binding protein [Halomonas sp. MG34]